MLKFSKLSSNAKLKWLGKGAYSFSTLAGHACIGAHECLAKVIETPEGRRIQDGPSSQFRCYAASQELIFKNLYEQRKHNMNELMKVTNSKDEMVKLMSDSLPEDAKIIRLYVSGDFSTQRIFDSWLEVARQHENVRFYAYTKSLIFWVKRLDSIPSNVILCASYGGKWDRLIEPNGLRFAKVVMSEYEARKLGLPIDTDDKYAMLDKYKHTSFCHVIHGSQKAGTVAARVWKAQIDGKRKFHGYNSGKSFGKYYKKNKLNGGIHHANVKS